MLYGFQKSIVIIFACFIVSFSATSQTLYFIGNDNTWSNTSNWSLTSGGPAAGIYPDANTTAVFDEFSGNCNLTGINAECKNLIYNTLATFTLDKALTVVDTFSYVRGNLVINTRMTTGSLLSENTNTRNITGTSKAIYISGEPGLCAINGTNWPNQNIDSLIFQSCQATIRSTNEPKFNYVEFKGNAEVYGNNTIKTWIFANGFSVYFQNGSIQTVTEDMRTSKPFCDGLAAVLAFLQEPELATLRFITSREIYPEGFYFRRIMGEDIINGRPNPIRYRNGVDGGDNKELRIGEGLEVPPRTLYWVNGPGNWTDRTHWSLTSGGASGACIPTATDIVIFDNSSFLANGNVVTAKAEVYASEFIYRSANNRADFRMPALNLRRSLQLEQPVTWNIVNLNLVGVDNTVDLTVTSTGNILQNVNVISLRNVTLKDNLAMTGTFNFENFPTSARFLSNGFSITANRFVADGSQMSMNVANSLITITGEQMDGTLDMPLILRNPKFATGGTSNTLWKLTGEQTGYESSAATLGSVWFSAPGGYAYAFGSGAITLRSMRFDGSGRIFENAYVVDSLIFTPGHQYTLESGKNITINKLFASPGDICKPISIEASVSGSKANMIMPAATVSNISFTEIKDMAASGATNRDAGNGSVDLGGNSGWQFRDPNAIEIDQFLGPDKFICGTERYRIEINYDTSEVSRYSWNGLPLQKYTGPDGFVPGEVLPGKDTIFATVEYKTGCTQNDTVIVTIDEVFEVKLQQDTTLCNGSSLALGNLNSPANVNYLWSTAETTPTIVTDKAADIKLTGTRGACIFSDSISISAFDLRSQSIGRDTVLCEADDITLSFPAFSGNVLWSDGSTAPSLVVNETNTYWAEFSQDICTFRDSTNVTFEDAFSIFIGNDTTLCNEASLVLSTGRDAGTFTWSTGATTPSITVSNQGQYIASVQNGACQASDTININSVSIKPFTLGGNQLLCEGDSLRLSIPQGFQGTYNWSTGASTPDINVKENGTYSLLIKEDICSLGDTIEVTFDESFVVNLGADTILCEGESLNLSLDIPNAFYTWSLNEITDNQITVNEEGNYAVTVSRGACLFRDDINVDIIQLTDFTLGEDTTLCEGATLSLAAPTGGSNQFLWSDGSTNSEIQVSTPDNYWLEISQGRCSVSDSIIVGFDPKIDFAGLGEDTTLCKGESITLGHSISDVMTQWNTDSQAATITVDSAGTYFVALTRGQCTAEDIIDISITEINDFSIGQDAILCEGEQLTLNAPQNSLNRLWSDGSTGDALTISDGGTYWLQLNEGRCTLSDSIIVTYDEAINVNLGRDTTLCSGESLVLMSNIGEGINNWSDGSQGDNITVSAPGIYSLNVSRGQCVGNDSIRVSYIDVDGFSIGMDTTLCEGEILILSAELSADAIYQWQDGSNDPTFTVTTDGIYNVDASIERCGATASITVSYQQPPSIDLGQDTSFCAPSSLILNAGLSGALYQWQDGSTQQTLGALNSGTYQLTVTDGACTVTDSIKISIQDIPTLNIAAQDVIELCQGDSVILTSSVADVQYMWQDGSNTNQYLASQSGIYQAEMTLGVCTVVDQVEVIVNPNPDASLPADAAICEGESFSLSANDIATYQYTWSNNGSGPQIMIAEEGSYSLTVTDDKGCMDNDDFNLTVKPLPVFSLGEDVTLCEGDSTSIIAEPFYDNLIWNPTGSGSSIKASKEGTIWAEANLNGCSYRDSVEISVQAFPIVNLGNDTIICENTSLVLDATNQGATYNWSNGATTESITIMEKGTYQVEVNINECSITEQITVDTKETPSFTLAEDRTICDEDSYNLVVNNPGRWAVTWNTGDQGDAINVTENGTYTATATVNGCSASDEFILTIQPLPQFDLGPTISKCEDLSVPLFVDRSDVEVIWQDGTIGNSIEASTPGTYIATAMTSIGCEYIDEVEVVNRECVNFTIYLPNAFSPNRDGQNDEYFVSVPEGVLLQQFELYIFDRWGNKVFESFDINQRWTGNGLGYESLQPGVYNYVLKVRYNDDYNQDIEDVFKGNITLLL